MSKYHFLLAESEGSNCRYILIGKIYKRLWEIHSRVKYCRCPEVYQWRIKILKAPEKIRT